MALLFKVESRGCNQYKFSILKISNNEVVIHCRDKKDKKKPHSFRWLPWEAKLTAVFSHSKALQTHNEKIKGMIIYSNHQFN